VPTQLQRALSSETRIQKLATARAIFVGGAALPESLAQEARAKKLPIIPVYGMTETAAMVAAVPVQDFLENPSAGAVPMGEARFHIEADGRLRILSPALFHGYQGQPRIDRAAGYLTDDEARVDANGRLRVIGRIDRLINSGGEKIDPREVEVAVAKLDGVKEVLAVGMPDSEWGQRLVVYYTGVELRDWKPRLQAQLVNFKIPKEMRWVDRLPLDEKGKFKVGASLVKTAEQRSQGGLNTGRTTAVFINEAPTGPVLPVRKTQNLRKGRRSAPGLRYFITLCTKDRRSSLANPATADAILAAWRGQHADGDYVFHCGTVMPDHIHYLFTLGERLSLGQCLIKLKAKTKEALQAVGLSWQRDFYDHWLRADDSMEGFAKYIYLNPYQKSLLAVEDSWPYWHLNREYRPEFVLHLSEAGTPPVEWLGETSTVDQLIDADLEV
jgi:REP element-mobilizing transposase RayT